MSNSKPLKVIIHWDINGTTMAKDSTDEGIPLENANVILAKLTMGRIDGFSWVASEPTGPHSDDGTISYYDYLKTLGGDPRPLGRRFTEEGQPGAHRHLIAQELVQSEETLLFLSFLQAKDLGRMILRTFGGDVDLMIEKLRSLGHRSEILKGRFIHSANEEIKLVLENGQTYQGMDQINHLYLTTEQDLALQEDYHYWANGGKQLIHAKQLMGHPKMLQFFFDDNPCVHLISSPYNHQCRIHRINTISALQDPNYYTNLIRPALPSS